VPSIEVIHRGKAKRLTAQQKVWLRRRQAIEPVIGHAKADHRMDRCWLKGAEGDALHAVLCAAGFNIRWLMRAIVAQAAKAFFFGLLWMVSLLQMLLGGRQSSVQRAMGVKNQLVCPMRSGARPLHGLVASAL
jgi:IS5 family transposase